MEGLAHAGNGTAEFVKGGERMQPKVRDLPIHHSLHALFYIYLDECMWLKRIPFTPYLDSIV